MMLKRASVMADDKIPPIPPTPPPVEPSTVQPKTATPKDEIGKIESEPPTDPETAAKTVVARRTLSRLDGIFDRDDGLGHRIDEAQEERAEEIEESEAEEEEAQEATVVRQAEEEAALARAEERRAVQEAARARAAERDAEEGLTGAKTMADRFSKPRDDSSSTS